LIGGGGGGGGGKKRKGKTRENIGIEEKEKHNPFSPANPGRGRKGKGAGTNETNCSARTRKDEGQILSEGPLGEKNKADRVIAISSARTGGRKKKVEKMGAKKGKENSGPEMQEGRKKKN